MRWPFTPDDWIAFFFPSIVMILFEMIASSSRVTSDGIVLNLLGIYSAAVLSLMAGVYLVKRDMGAVERGMRGALLGIGIFCLNCAVAFAGCAAIGVVSTTFK
jgi:general stress protein CsbA